ncbi:hypothetical protein CRE_08012 [Caenorhabditis remanei]|uniref:Uncharacterized protein n=1 Tax=Caenorhabditis remanei TaxID=31234 RepID=E3M3T2_CAERE|nr:hypothetical protein CRE_08012 [Caenorhabditis remanei]
MQRGGNGPGFRGFRPTHRGRGGPRRGNGGRNQGFRPELGENRDRPNSPDRRSGRSEERYGGPPPPPPNFNNYRVADRPQSRSPSPPRNRNQRGFEGRPNHDVRDREDRRERERRRHSPPPQHAPPPQNYRRDDRGGYERPESRNSEIMQHDSIRNSSLERNRPAALKPTDKETAGYWKLKLADADEKVRRAEYELHRAKLNQDIVRDAYREYTETTVPQELLNPKPTW